MDFLILKVNGKDISTSSHEDAVKCFQSAQEPIVVEVLRRHHSTMSEIKSCIKTPVISNQEELQHLEHCQKQYQKQHKQPNQNNGENTFTLFVSTAVQTDWAGLNDNNGFEPVILNIHEQNNDSFDDILAHEIDFQKNSTDEKFGLAMCYNSSSDSEDTKTNVYISEIVPKSLVARDDRLREGDQILQESSNDSTEASTHTYQNSMIEKLILQQQQQNLEKFNRIENNEMLISSLPIVPSHFGTTPSSTCPDLTTCISKNTSQKFSIAQEFNQQQLQRCEKWMQEAYVECVRKVDEMNVSKRKHVKLVETYSNRVWTDTEHIYETIPESDSENIYSFPYEEQNWLHHSNNNHIQIKNQVEKSQITNCVKIWNSPSKNNSSGEEKDTSSAYNTGESCNSITLTSKLKQPSLPHPSTLVLCPPNLISANNKSTSKFHCNCFMSLVSPSKSIKNQSLRQSTQVIQQQQQRKQQQNSQVGLLTTEAMYTNVTNLQKTIKLQHQLFKQSMSRRKFNTSHESSCASHSQYETDFQAPNLAQYQFVASHQISRPVHFRPTVEQIQKDPNQECHNQIHMEWKVKRRPDGSRYITRRPIRNRILRHRVRINEENQKTDKHTVSEIKVARYSNKEEKKRQLECAKEQKQYHQEVIQQEIQKTKKQLICDYINENKFLKKSFPNIDQGY